MSVPTLIAFGCIQASVMLVTVGVVIATLSKPSASKAKQSPEDATKYAIGILMLVVSSFFTGFLGLLQERTYKKYGPCWQEGVFYTVGYYFLSSRPGYRP